MRRWIVLAGFLGLIAWPVVLWAQAGTVNIRGVFDTTNTLVQPGDATNNAVRVNVVAGSLAQSGTWTVQPGNTANTTPWLMTIQQGGNTANVNGSNQLLVNCANCSGSGVSQTDQAAWSAGVSLFASGGGVFQTTATANALTNGQMGTFQVTAARALFVNPRDSTGREFGPTNPLAVHDTSLSVAPGMPGVLQSGPMVQGVVGVPIYGPGTVQPLTLTTLGALRADVSGSTVNASQPTGSAAPVGAFYVGGNGSGNLTGVTVCDTPKTISVTTNTQLVTGTAAKHIYICSINLTVASATNVALVSGTGTVCATGIGGVSGGTTAATGWNLAATGGIAQGTGVGWIMRTAATGDNLCILVSATNQTSGALTYTVY